MSERVLITGGAGFIGSHITDRLLALGYRVRILDNFAEQVHGPAGRRPNYLAREAELIAGDVRDPEVVGDALREVDAVIHLASAVGVGQSMYRIADYVDVNELGTATLLQVMTSQRPRRLVVASSMSIYGEGLARTLDAELVEPAQRTAAQMREGRWEIEDDRGRPLVPVPTPENKQPLLASIYALNKFAQEQMCLLAGRAYDIPTVALRLFNVYGSRQALSNPYTGVLAIFAARLLHGRPPLIFEDGQQRRDFIHVSDVARAFVTALRSEAAVGHAINIGSGEPRSVLEIAKAMARAMGREDVEPLVTRKYRAGDIRHCFADVGAAERLLGFSARMRFADGIGELVEWLRGEAAVDRVERATDELAARGLVA